MTVKQAKTTTAASHVAGIFGDMSTDGPEIGTLVAVIDRARNLPNRKTMGKQDPYCAMRLGKEAKKTETDRRGGQTPKWDQELRFTVHDGPDYMKLKCSIFNDDKKTDLIGEAWIDLREVVVSGGGQNDLWHNLNFKGKYAGEIRVELTYYDTRPIPEAQAEKKRQRNLAHSVASDNMSSTSSSRQLGPREIKRRPLPPGPGGQATPPSALPPHPQTQSLPPAQPLFQQSYPNSPQPMDDYQQYTVPPPRLPQQYRQHHQCAPQETQDDYGYQQPSVQSMELYNPPERHDDYAEHEGHFDSDNSFEYETHEPRRPSYPSAHSSSPASSPHSFSGRDQLWQNPSSPISPHTMPTPFAISQYHSSPQSRPSPPSVVTAITSQQQSRSPRNSVSPTKHGVYRDSPLRQAVHPNEVQVSTMRYEEAFEDEEPPPPPPPRSHRGSLPRPGTNTSLPTTPYGSMTPRSLLKHGLVEDQSPLQSLEHVYSSQKVSPAPLPNNFRQSEHGSYSQPGPDSQRKPRPSTDRRNSAVGDFPAPHQLSQNYGIDLFDEPVETDRQGRYLRRESAVEQQDLALQTFQRSPAIDNADPFDERNTYCSEPRIVRPRAVSPNPNHTIARKSVSPHPYSSTERKAISSSPYGPDSYDVLNPGSSPCSSPYVGPEHSMEAARQAEVERMRDQGPIIGNDGRVIDPSDHLPSDTWAPEPERKNRKPEHVIRFRTKEIRASPNMGSSPVSSRPMSASVSPYQSSPIATPPAPVPSYQTSPNPPSAPSSGRNRLQKQMPTRPLPTQPFQHAHTSPAAIPQVHGREYVSHNPQRNSVHSSPASGLPPRPPLSEYQVPLGQNYSPRGTYQQQNHPPTPTKMPKRPQSYAYGGPQDTLAAEMSMIDIGPSRGGRTAVRQSRGYGGY